MCWLKQELRTIFRVGVFIAVFCEVHGYFNEELNGVRFDDTVWHQRSPRVAPINNEFSLRCERPDFYICEEPPDTIPPEDTKVCDYRSWQYHEQIYRWEAGRGCLQFIPDFLYVEGTNPFNLTNGCHYGHLFAPCLEMVRDDGTCGCYPYDPNLEEVARAVRDALIPAARDRWERCFQAAAHCCSHVMSADNEIYPDHCPPTFDAWTCWDAAPLDTVASEICSEFAYSNSGPSCNHFSTKTCFANGTWELQTDYSTCSITPRLLRRYKFHIGMLSFSVVSCLPAVVIFFFYKKLRITRVILHRNLLIAIITRNVLVIISRATIYIDEITNEGDTVMSNHGVWCRALSLAERTAANAVFVCMLVEGTYLHRAIVAVFRKKLNLTLLYSVGAVITLAPVTAWAIVMGVHNDHSCWLIFTMDHIQWILDGPRLSILLINTGLFIDILRVLLTKIRNSENVNQLSTTKATLFLMPLFGSQFLLTAFRPNTDSCIGEESYYFITYTLEGLQGFVVAMLYCYINKEVHTLVKATYKKTENAFMSRMRPDSDKYRRTTLGFSTDRRMTFSTGLENNQIEEIEKDQYAEIGPKIHVAEIVSIQTSERLADILEPVYEVVENGITNEGYDSLERSEDVQYPVKPIIDDYSKTSSVADAKDWVRCISSPSSSMYDNSLNEYEVNYLERKFPTFMKKNEVTFPKEDILSNNSFDYEDNYLAIESSIRSNNEIPSEVNEYANEEIQECNDNTYEDNIQPDTDFTERENIESLHSEDGTEKENMVNEIMQFLENTNIVLNANKLSPNRNDGDNIVFVD